MAFFKQILVVSQQRNCFGLSDYFRKAAISISGSNNVFKVIKKEYISKLENETNFWDLNHLDYYFSNKSRALYKSQLTVTMTFKEAQKS